MGAPHLEGVGIKCDLYAVKYGNYDSEEEDHYI